MILIIFILIAFYGKPLLNFFKEKDLKKKCFVLNVDMTKVLKRRKIELLLMFAILMFIPKDYQKFFILLIYLVYKQPYFKLNRELKKLKEELNLQFSIWLRMMEVLLSYHTVVLAIEKSIASAPHLMKHHLEILVKKLSHDPLNRDIYLSFMSDYEELNIERSMNHLYRYAVLGSQDANLQLSNLIDDNAKELIKVRESLFERRLNFYSWFGLLPMLLVSLSFLGLMFLVITNLMEGGWNI